MSSEKGSALFNLSGKVALVTGSTKGIGKAIALELARAGAKVVISSRKAEVVKAVSAEFIQHGLEALGVPCNVGNKNELQHLVDATMKHWGHIDILVCNAGINPTFGPMLKVEDSAYDKIMDVNVRSIFWLANMVLPQMAARKDGAVILISSIAAFNGSDVKGLYGVSKSAINGLARALAVEWGPHNIRINCIAPGLVKTDFSRALWEDPVHRVPREKGAPLRRLGEPQDMGGIAVFLASDAARFVTGQVIVADGGVSIGW